MKDKPKTCSRLWWDDALGQTESPCGKPAVAMRNGKYRCADCLAKDVEKMIRRKRFNIVITPIKRKRESCNK